MSNTSCILSKLNGLITYLERFVIINLGTKIRYGTKVNFVIDITAVKSFW